MMSEKTLMHQEKENLARMLQVRSRLYTTDTYSKEYLRVYSNVFFRKLEKYSPSETVAAQKHLEKTALQVGLNSQQSAAQLWNPERSIASFLLQHVLESDMATRSAILINQYNLVSDNLTFCCSSPTIVILDMKQA